MTCLNVNWLAPKNCIDGVQRLGYANADLVGLNGLLVGSLVRLNDPTGVYQRKWEALRRQRLANEQDPMQRAMGVRMRTWSSGPWRITYVTSSSFGVTLDLEQEINQFDLIVRPDTVTLWDAQ